MILTSSIKNTFKLIEYVGIKKSHIVYLVILLFTSSILEILSLGFILPLVEIFFGIQSTNFFSIEKIEFFVFNTLNLNVSQENLKLILISFFFIFIILSILFRTVVLKYSLKISNDTSSIIGNKIFNEIFEKNYFNFIKTNSAEILSNIAQKIDDCSLSFFSFLNFLSNFIFSISIILALYLYLPLSSLLLFFPIIIFFVLIFLSIKKKLSLNSHIININRDSLIENTQNGIGLYKEIIINNALNKFKSKFSFAINTIYEKKFINTYVSSAPRIYIEAVGFLFVGILILYSFLSSVEINNLYPNIILCIVGAQKFLPVSNQIFVSSSFIVAKSDSVKTILTYLNINQERIKHKKEYKVNIDTINSINVANLSFKYSNSPYLFQNLNIEIKNKDKIGIYGRSGSGKSTFIDILCGFIEIQDSYLVNDQKLEDINIQTFRNKISLVNQYTYIENGTFLDNITSFSDKPYSIEKVKECIKLADLETFINQFDKGYDQLIGSPNGLKLSGGQRQKIAIARSLYKSFDLLILDEATNSLDKESEDKIITSILNMNKIVIIISHNLDLLKKCSQVFELKDSKFVKIEN